MADKGPHEDPLYGRKNPVNLTSVWNKQRARVDPQAEFNNLDRAWRKQYLLDKKLTANDGNWIQVYQMPEYRKARYNILRRIGRFPLDVMENVMMKAGMSPPTAYTVRRFSGAMAKTMIFCWVIAFNFNNTNINNWESAGGFKVFQDKPWVDPDGKYYESVKEQTKKVNPNDYYDQGFKSSPLFK